jgi:ABC-2 type transport system permease protein
MKQQLSAISAEWLKCRHVRITWVTFIAFGLGPIMGGLFLVLLSNPDLGGRSMLSAKAQAMSFSSSWSSYFGMLAQVVGVGGVLVFGFVASWLFGREYSEGTAKDLLALPVSRQQILNAKFLIYFVWCIALSLSNLVIGLVIGVVLQLPLVEPSYLYERLFVYAVTTLLTVLLGAPVSFFALFGKGYLAPLGFVALALVFAQIIAAAGWGAYFPWSVPGLYSGVSGTGVKLHYSSYVVVGLMFIVGYLACIRYWNKTDHTK